MPLIRKACLFPGNSCHSTCIPGVEKFLCACSTSIVKRKAFLPTLATSFSRRSTVGSMCSLVVPRTVFFLMKRLIDLSCEYDRSNMTVLLFRSAFGRVITGDTWFHCLNGGPGVGPWSAPLDYPFSMKSSTAPAYCTALAWLGTRSVSEGGPHNPLGIRI